MTKGMNSRIVTVESSERLETRRSPMTTWLQLGNFVTLSIVSLLLFKLYKIIVQAVRWLTVTSSSFEHIRTILFLGPKTEFNLHLLQELSHKFNTPVLALQDEDSTTRGRCVLLYGGDTCRSRDEVLALHNSVLSAHGPVDLLIVSDHNSNNFTSHPGPIEFLTDLNRQLLTQFWIVMAFLPGMLSRNRGSIMSIALDRTTSLANTGVMRTVYEDVLQKKSDVTLTLVEKNTFIDKLLPALPQFIQARLVVKHLCTMNLVPLPSALEYIFISPILLGKIYLKPVLDFWWRSRSRTPRLTNR